MTTASELKSAINYLLSKGQIVSSQSEGPFMGVRMSTYRHEKLGVEVTRRICGDVQILILEKQHPKLFCKVTTTRGTEKVEVNNEKALEVFLLEYRFQL